MSSTLPPLPLASVALQQPGAYAEVVEQLSRTVQQLVALVRSGPSAAAANPALLPPQPPLLSHRECEVLQRIAAGDSNKAIARALELSPHTVKRHVANILDKLGLQSRGQAAAWWLRERSRPRDH